MEKDYTTDRKGIERGTIEKILKMIQETSTPLTPSEISAKTNIQFDSVKSTLEFLSNLDKIQIITNGKVSLIQLKKEEISNATKSN
jgi:response regulator of citrate/malate metabolism